MKFPHFLIDYGPNNFSYVRRAKISKPPSLSLMSTHTKNWPPQHFAFVDAQVAQVRGNATPKRATIEMISRRDATRFCIVFVAFIFDIISGSLIDCRHFTGLHGPTSSLPATRPPMMRSGLPFLATMLPPCDSQLAHAIATPPKCALLCDGFILSQHTP